MSTISVNADNAKILLALVQDMVANRMAVHQVTPEIQAAIQEVAVALAAVPAEEPVNAEATVDSAQEAAPEVTKDVTQEAAPEQPSE